jgi:hypothetical protein
MLALEKATTVTKLLEEAVIRLLKENEKPVSFFSAITKRRK